MSYFWETNQCFKKAKACLAQIQLFFLFRKHTSDFKLSSFPYYSRGKKPQQNRREMKSNMLYYLLVGNVILVTS